MSENSSGATSHPVDLLRIDPRKPESIMSEGEKRIPELVMQERIRQLEADLDAMTKARDYEKEAHARTVAYYTVRSETTPRMLDLLTRIQAAAEPIDMAHGDEDARIPAALWREFVDAHADLLRASAVRTEKP